MKTDCTKLNREAFERMELTYPSNLVIVEMGEEKEIMTSAGIKINFNPDVQYAVANEDDGSSHVADVCAVTGRVVKTVDRLYFNRRDVKRTMSWECDMELQEDDIVWFHPLIAKNCSEILVDRTLYKVIPYEDLFVAKRWLWRDKWKGEKYEEIICLNGNVLLETIEQKKMSDFDVLEHGVDEERGIVRFNGLDNKRYQAVGVADMPNLKDGDLVVIQKGSYPFYLERFKYNATFDNGKMYFCVQKRFIQAVIQEGL
jgi:hypothetical protein